MKWKIEYANDTGSTTGREPKPWSWCKRIDLSSACAVEIALTMSQWMAGVNWLATRNWMNDGNMIFVNVFIGPLRFGVERTMPPNGEVRHSAGKTECDQKQKDL